MTPTLPYTLSFFMLNFGRIVPKTEQLSVRQRVRKKIIFRSLGKSNFDSQFVHAENLGIPGNEFNRKSRHFL